MPLPPSHPGFGVALPESGDAELAAGAAPRADIDDDRDEPAIPLMPSRARPPSSRPEESFADLNADLSDRAPAAPVTPWRSVPALSAGPVEVTPPRGSPVGFSRDFDRDDEHEATIVGKVPENLLSLSSSGDENTRAFTAPRELIELAKRKREESRASRAPVEAHVRVTERPPAAPPVPVDEREAYDSPGAPAVPVDEREAYDSPGAPAVPVDEREAYDSPAAPAAPRVMAESNPPPSVEEDAAPPVARTVSGEMEAVALPSRRTRESEEPEPSGPEIEIGPGSELSDPSARVSGAPSGAVSIPFSESLPSVAKARPRRWLLLAISFILIGVVIARWRDIAALLHSIR
jgi:hypothetical protein